MPTSWSVSPDFSLAILKFPILKFLINFEFELGTIWEILLVYVERPAFLVQFVEETAFWQISCVGIFVFWQIACVGIFVFWDWVEGSWPGWRLALCLFCSIGLLTLCLFCSIGLSVCFCASATLGSSLWLVVYFEISNCGDPRIALSLWWLPQVKVFWLPSKFYVLFLVLRRTSLEFHEDCVAFINMVIFISLILTSCEHARISISQSLPQFFSLVF